MALLVLPKSRLCVSGQNQMCHLCGWLKLFLKKCGGKKNKKHWVGLSVGLLAVPFQYGLYVFGHLSKWFVFVLMFKFWSVYRLWNGRPTIGYNGLQLGEVAEIEAQMFSFAQKFNRSTAVEFSTKPAILPNCCCAFGFLFRFV